VETYHIVPHKTVVVHNSVLVQGGSNMTGTDLYVNKLLCSAACLHTNQSRSYLNHLVLTTGAGRGWLAGLVLYRGISSVITKQISIRGILWFAFTDLVLAVTLCILQV